MKLSSDLPLYESIRRELKSRIESGELAVGMRILPEIELAKQVGVSRSTARKALQSLEDEGLISRTAGRGSFVLSAQGNSAHNARLRTLSLRLGALQRGSHNAHLAQGFLCACAENGFAASIHADASPVTERDLYLNQVQTVATGIAFSLTTRDEVSALRAFQAENGALLLVDRATSEIECDTVQANNNEMARLVTRELAKRGHKDIGLITLPLESSLEEDRYQGYAEALKQAGRKLQEENIIVDDVSGHEPLRVKLLSLLGRKHRPTALFCASAELAGSVVHELRALEYQVPDDIELAIVCDRGFTRDLQTPLLCAEPPSFEIGAQAAQVLIERIQNPDKPVDKRYLEFSYNFEPRP